LRFTGTRIVVDRLALAQEVNPPFECFRPDHSNFLAFIVLRCICYFDGNGGLCTNVERLRQIAGNLAGRFVFRQALTLEAILVDLE